MMARATLIRVWEHSGHAASRIIWDPSVCIVLVCGKSLQSFSVYIRGMPSNLVVVIFLKLLVHFRWISIQTASALKRLTYSFAWRARPASAFLVYSPHAVLLSFLSRFLLQCLPRFPEQREAASESPLCALPCSVLRKGLASCCIWSIPGDVSTQSSQLIQGSQRASPFFRFLFDQWQLELYRDSM